MKILGEGYYITAINDLKEIDMRLTYLIEFLEIVELYGFAKSMVEYKKSIVQTKELLEDFYNEKFKSQT